MATDRTGLRPGHPIRTCIGCRGTDSRSALLRVVLGTGADGIAVVLPDPERRLPGRGAWLHPGISCLELAVRRRAFGRALRTSTPADHSAVEHWVRAHPQEPPSEHETESGFDADEHPMSTQR
ncbi:MAG TPA: YlxR family protein [Ornithinibacter sp.]|nr:YlxR family protein [Ornithinibacter sp.]HPV90678.1 YlxR family protein [Ornithinibacter sp.]